MPLNIQYFYLVVCINSISVHEEYRFEKYRNSSCNVLRLLTLF